MKKFGQALSKYAADIIMACGAAAVAVGVGMIYIPAGWIVGGALAIAGAVLSCWGGDEQ